MLLSEQNEEKLNHLKDVKTLYIPQAMNDYNFVHNAALRAGNLLDLTEWFDDLDFLRVYKYLHALVGGDLANMKHWLQTPNKFLDGQIPSQLLTTEIGIIEVLDELRYYFYK
jgi:hypothetical protein